MTAGFAYSSLFNKNLPPPAPPWTGFPKYNFIGGHNDPERIPASALADAATTVLRRRGKKVITHAMQLCTHAIVIGSPIVAKTLRNGMKQFRAIPLQSLGDKRATLTACVQTPKRQQSRIELVQFGKAAHRIEHHAVPVLRCRGR